jgi:hypothetical protein
MTPKLTMTTAAFVRVLSAVGALSVPMAVPSMGASIDVPAVDSGMPSSIEGRHPCCLLGGWQVGPRGDTS